MASTSGEFGSAAVALALGLWATCGAAAQDSAFCAPLVEAVEAAGADTLSDLGRSVALGPLAPPFADCVSPPADFETCAVTTSPWGPGWEVSRAAAIADLSAEADAQARVVAACLGADAIRSEPAWPAPEASVKRISLLDAGRQARVTVSVQRRPEIGGVVQVAVARHDPAAEAQRAENDAAVAAALAVLNTP